MTRRFVGSVVFASACFTLLAPAAVAQVNAETVRRAIDRGVTFLERQQKADGSWEIAADYPGGGTSLALLALLECGKRPDDKAVAKGLQFLRGIKSEKTYVVGLQTMVFCLAKQREDLGRIKENVIWLEKTQIKTGHGSGMWGYGFGGRGDNSNTQYALLGLREAAEIGVKINAETWRLVREHFERVQGGDGAWGYDSSGSSGSMTVAGISSLIIAGLRIHEGEEKIENGVIKNCGKWKENDAIARGLGWLGRQKDIVSGNPGGGGWHFYYLYGLERAGRLAGQRFIGPHDWYREGAAVLCGDPIRQQLAQRPGGMWEGSGMAESNDLIATTFALLFLAKGRAPVLMHKLRHDAADAKLVDDWNNDRNDVRNLTEFVSRDWEKRLTWQVVDAKVKRAGDVPGRVEALMQAPVLFVSGHDAPAFDDLEKQVLKSYVEQGGFILADACCSRREFADGFRQLCRELFPEQSMKTLPRDHEIWKAEFSLKPDDSLEGLDLGCRTSIILSKEDLSCYWEQRDNPESLRPTHIGTNVLAYATGKESLLDKLDARKIVNLQAAGPANRWTLQIAKLKHGGDWNVAPLAVPNLMASLRDNLKMDVAVQQQELAPLDQNLVKFPFVYMHGRSQFNLDDAQTAKIREHLQRGGTLFADACCGREPFDTAFRAFAKKLFPDADLKRIPLDHELFGSSAAAVAALTPSNDALKAAAGPRDAYGYDLQKVQFTKAMPRPEGEPYLEGIDLDGRFAVIYSKYDVGCALERHQGSDCRGYTHESAVKIATNVILYSLLQ